MACVLSVVELKEGLSRMGSNIKQKIIDSIKGSWKSINAFAMAHRTSPEELVEQEVDNVLSQMTQEEEDKIETGCKLSHWLDFFSLKKKC